MKNNLNQNRPTYIEGDYKASEKFNGGSRLVYGCSGLGGVWGTQEEQESIDCLLYAFEHGVSVLDTSPSYANSQLYVGKALKQWKGERPFISTKVGRLYADKADEYKMDYSPEGMKRSVMNSLELIGIDQLDLLFLHEPQIVPMDRADEILDTLKGFKEAGYTASLGVGGNPSGDFYKICNKKNFDVISGWIRLDACNLDALNDDIPLCKKEGIAYQAASSLHMSLLGHRFDLYAKERPNSEWISNRDVDRAIRTKTIADKYDMPLSTLSLRYLFSMKEADRVVIGARKMDQIKNCLDAWNQGKLSKDIFEEITDSILNYEE